MQIGVITGKHAQRSHGFLIWSDPAQRVRQRAGRVRDDESVARIGLAFTGIQLGDATHRRPGQIADLDPHAPRHGDCQCPDRRGLVDHHQGRPMSGQHSYSDIGRRSVFTGIVVSSQPNSRIIWPAEGNHGNRNGTVAATCRRMRRSVDDGGAAHVVLRRPGRR
ncbi:hypothetical protein BG844_05845 [Couchioplanes caeruleus subsp. caeruleus]|uniref:Uncharacterized protein n=1 Tax=Couchioplanes caeruleus subsp. caeruleus TaxID=56427 RepID=A0A1K0FR63_9ACTN|nr:hypothetical protein BG844_05845 [Couchioplanes caeruleus subsp. caeruleus]